VILLLQVLSELLDGSPSLPADSTPATTADTALDGKESPLRALSDVCSTLAFGAETGEELDEISRGSLTIKVLDVCSVFEVSSQLLLSCGQSFGLG